MITKPTEPTKAAGSLMLHKESRIGGKNQAIGIVALVGVYVFAELSRSQGAEWGSLVGPEAVWPAVVGFSGLALVILVAVEIARQHFARSARRD